MAESENLKIDPYVRLDDNGKTVGFVRAAVIMEARAEINRLEILDRDQRKVGCDAYPGAFRKRSPQPGDYYVVEQDATAACWAANDFLMRHRRINELDIPGMPAAKTPGASDHPAVHGGPEHQNALPAFAPARPTTLPPLSSWDNPADAPPPAVTPVAIIPPPPGTDDSNAKPAPPTMHAPATPINNDAERVSKMDPTKEQPALPAYNTGVDTANPPKRGVAMMQEVQAKIDEHGSADYVDEAHRGSGETEPDPGFGHYNPPMTAAVTQQDGFERAYPPQAFPQEIRAAGPSPEPPVQPGMVDKPHAPANATSTIPFRDPTSTDEDSLLEGGKQGRTVPADEKIINSTAQHEPPFATDGEPPPKPVEEDRQHMPPLPEDHHLADGEPKPTHEADPVRPAVLPEDKPHE